MKEQTSAFFESNIDQRDLEAEDDGRFSCEHCWFTAENPQHLTNHYETTHSNLDVEPSTAPNGNKIQSVVKDNVPSSRMLSSITPLQKGDLVVAPELAPVPETVVAITVPATEGGLTEMEIMNAAFNQSIFECYHCWFTFETSQMLAEHISSVHGGGVKLISSFDDENSNQNSSNFSPQGENLQPYITELDTPQIVTAHTNNANQPKDNQIILQYSNLDQNVIVPESQANTVDMQCTMETNYEHTIEKPSYENTSKRNILDNSIELNFQATTLAPQQAAQASEFTEKLTKEEAQCKDDDSIFETVAQFNSNGKEVTGAENLNMQKQIPENNVISQKSGNMSISTVNPLSVNQPANDNVSTDLEMVEASSIINTTPINTETVSPVQEIIVLKIMPQAQAVNRIKEFQQATDALLMTESKLPTVPESHDQQNADLLTIPQQSSILLPQDETATEQPPTQRQTYEILNLSSQSAVHESKSSLQLSQAAVPVSQQATDFDQMQQSPSKQASLPDLGMEGLEPFENLIIFSPENLQSKSNQVQMNTAQAVPLLNDSHNLSNENVIDSAAAIELENNVTMIEQSNENISGMAKNSVVTASTSSTALDESNSDGKSTFFQEVNAEQATKMDTEQTETLDKTVFDPLTVKFAIECSLCDYSTGNPVEMETHLSCEGHFSLGQENICQHCAYMSTSKEELIKHGQSHNKEFSLSDYVCLKCDYKASNSENIDGHWSQAHA